MDNQLTATKISLHDNVRYRMTNCEVEEEHFQLSGIKQIRSHKPCGVWYSYGDDWLYFVRREQFEQAYGKYFYAVEVSAENILKITNFCDLLSFTESYKDEDTSDTWKINWKRVAKEYDGIEISPYIRSARMDVSTAWYYSWDVSSGCIWNGDIGLTRVCDHTDDIELYAGENWGGMGC